jgi:hypothetical protein
MKSLFINVVIFFVAILLLSTIGVLGIIFALIYSLIHFRKYSYIKYWSNTIFSINVGIDKIGNVILALFLNEYFVYDKKIYPFGSVDHTISHVLAVNLIKHKNVTRFGMFLVNVLEFLDPGHMEKSL